MTRRKGRKRANPQEHMPDAERVAAELATVDITRKWKTSIRNWPHVLNQLVIRFEDRIDF